MTEKNYSEGQRPRCPKSLTGRHDDEGERMYGHGGDGTPHHGLTRTCKRCGMREFVGIY